MQNFGEKLKPQQLNLMNKAVLKYAIEVIVTITIPIWYSAIWYLEFTLLFCSISG